MATWNGLQIFDYSIGDDECGMLRISFVDSPAVESNFLKFSKPSPMIFLDEEQHRVLGCVMRAEYPIYRRDGDREYYIRFGRETIRSMAEKYLIENRQNRVNIMHNSEELRGINMVQLFIKDESKGVVPKGFENIEDGSLFCEFHVTNAEVWKMIREGVLRGYSLEGFFTEKAELQEDKESLTKTTMKRNWKKVLAKIVSKFTEVTTDKGVLTYDGELEVGIDVYLLNADGEVVDAPDGDYTTEDKVITVEGGKVADVKAVEDLEEPLDEKIADEVDIHNLADEVKRLKEQNTSLLDRVKALEEKLTKNEDALRKMSAAKPAKEEVKANEVKPKGNSHEDFLARVAMGARK